MKSEWRALDQLEIWFERAFFTFATRVLFSVMSAHDVLRKDRRDGISLKDDRVFVFFREKSLSS